jgi:hypothetical protein
MVLIIWKPCRPQGTCKSRYKARRAEIVAQRQQDQNLARKIVRELTGCNPRVIKTIGED